MTEEKTPTTTKKRRTPAEMKAYHEGELKRLAAEEKAEVVRLLSNAHDTVEEAGALAAAAPLKPTIVQILTALKAQIAAAQK